jgi:hypothetical protein
VRGIAVPVVLAAVAGSLLAPAHAGEQASRIVDRTFLCATGYVGGVHQAPRTLLLRVRGEFVRATTLHTASPFGYPQLRAMGATTQTELALGTLKGEPIAYASIAGAKKARLFISADCQED